MRIETQITSDPNIMHFYPENKLAIESVEEFSDAKSIRRSPLAENIFDLSGICSILITPDFISITKEIDADWEELKPQILAEIIDFVAGGQDIMRNDGNTDKDLVKNIKGLINARIRPIIQKDGGDIEFKEFKNGVVYVELSGKCVGCPYTQRTLKDGVEKILRTYIEEVVSVEKYNN